MKKYQLEIKWGVIFVVAALLWLLFEKLMGWHGPKIDQHPTMTNLFAVVAIAVYVFALLDKRKQLGGVMTWKQGFVAGLLITAVVVVLSPLSQWLFHTFISPEYFPNAIAYSVENDLMTQGAAEQYFSLGSYLLQSVIGGAAMGVITSAVVALFVKKKAPATAAAES